MGENRIRDDIDIAEREAMKKTFTIYDIRFTNLKPKIFFLSTVYCLLSTVFFGCAKHQIIITKDPLKAGEHIRLAQIYEARGEMGLAAQEYTKAIEQDKTYAAAYFGLGNISYKKGNFKEAEDYYRKAIENTPADDMRNAMFYNNLSWVYIETDKELQEAEKLVQKAMLLDNERISVYLDTLGVIYTKLNEYSKAEDALLAAVKNAPDDKTALKYIYQHLSELYQLQGDKNKFNGMAEKLKELDK